MRIFLAVTLLLVSQTASAQEVSNRVKSAAFLEVIATRGVECALMQPWQAGALRALNIRDMQGWSLDRREAFHEETNRQLGEVDCQDETMKTWIDAASRGFDSEMLPPYLIVYRTLVGYEDPPPVFTQTTLRLRYQPAIEAINAKLASIEASGAVAEGGKPWPDYIESIEKAARGFVSTLANPDAPIEEQREAAAFVAQSAHVVELWLMDEDH